MTGDTDKSRVRQARGSVQEAIGKLIGDAHVEQCGADESEAGAREADAADTKAKPPRSTSSAQSRPGSGPRLGGARGGRKNRER
ncbi:hypothetical protein [Sphingomonas sp. Leaf38]|uniref:hypothetical protein n=1 Tax=Sphingomonas sp. Leaf38 TaxID=1736217 RepID=UPI000AB6D828|nr:hypothetical protein [Sphingomonas sp. Leaf38]